MRIHSVFKFLALFSLLFFSAITAQAQDTPLKVGFIYIGPVGDHGWSYQHNQARLALQKALGNKIKTTFVEKVNEGPDAQRVLNELAKAGNKLIFSTSFGFMNPTLKVARRYPNVKFEHATGYKRASNVSTYAGRFYQGRYVSGVIAGKMTKSNILGYVGSFPIPEVIRGIDAFTLGAQSVNPKIQIKVIWVNSWYDPAKETDAAKTLVDQGADVLAQHTDSPAPLQVAQARGIYGFGQASDMIKFAPDAQLTAIEDTWAHYYIARTKAVLDGTWKSQNTWGGMKEGFVTMAPYRNMPKAVKDLALKTVSALKNGTLHPFAGPITSQDGTLKVKKGDQLLDDDLLKINWYVKGVTGKLPH